jgi:glutathione synthase/RimK-type ligase-like ATP-grasp enzyme
VILIVSTDADEHTQVVLHSLTGIGAEAYVCDLSHFPKSMSLSMTYNSASTPECRVVGTDGRRISLDAVEAIWWRRPQTFSLDDRLTRSSHRSFALNEAHEAFAGLWQALDVFWVNHPTRDEVASRKAFQLRVAADAGLETPATLITNDPADARAFIEARGIGHVIYKAFSATAQEWRETRLIRAEELALLDHVRHAPVIFQEYIPATVDLRITIVGDEIFPAAIHSQDTSYPIDFRMELMRARIEATTLPEETIAGLRALMNALGLVYGAIDMRRTPDGRHVFLEVNPSGQWLFVEQATRQPIAACLARVLADGRVAAA